MTATQIWIGASIEELQAAYAAARRGEFSTAHRTRAALRQPDGSGAELAAASTGVGLAPSTWRPTGRVVVVLAAHAGAGASTVAVAVADALSKFGAPVRVIEVADPVRSGLAAATNAELGEDGSGWRRGRRDEVTVDRLAEQVGSIHGVPEPRPADSATGEMLVLDIGWPARDAFAATGWLATALADACVLVVFRPSVPGIRQTEYLLRDLAASGRAEPTLAAVGPNRWPGAATASSGPQLRAARSCGRVVSVPLDRRVGIDGITAEPLSKALSLAGREIAAALRSTADQSTSGRAG